MQQGGDRLGEGLIGLLREDPECYLNANPGFTPTLPGAAAGDFTMADLLAFAGV